MIITKTPFRISFFGGGTDYPDWIAEHGGAVLGTTINRYCYVSCRELLPFFEHRYRIVYSRTEHPKAISEIEHPAVRGILSHLDFHDVGLEIHHDADLPARTGLGSSSAFTVGLVHALKAFRGQYISKTELTKLAIHIEQKVVNETVGSQDQTLASFGGLNKIEFHRDGEISVSPLIAPSKKIHDLNCHLMLYFTGFARIASEIAKSKVANLKLKESYLLQMRSMVDEGIEILQKESRPLTDFGHLLHQAWTCKREISDRISNSVIDQIYDEARKAGALGGKLLGAGGGGFMLLFVEPKFQPKVKEALKHLLHVPFQFESEGSRVVLYRPYGL